MKKISIPYPERVCPATGKKFIPTRENQIYLNRAVQVKHNNEQAKMKRMDTNNFNDRVARNVKGLSKIHSYMLTNKLKMISAEYLDYEGIDFEAITSQNINDKTNKTVKWSLEYGFEPVDDQMKHYFIYKNQ